MIGRVIGLSVSDEMFVVRGGKKVVIERWKNGKRIWTKRENDRTEKLAVSLSH